MSEIQEKIWIIQLQHQHRQYNRNPPFHIIHPEMFFIHLLASREHVKLWSLMLETSSSGRP